MGDLFKPKKMEKKLILIDAQWYFDVDQSHLIIWLIFTLLLILDRSIGVR